MRRNQRGLTTLSALLGLLGVSLLATGAVVYQFGAVEVTVEEKTPEGDRVRLWVPGVLAPVAMQLIPDAELRRLPPEARRFLPAVRAAAEELRRVPDFVLVEVEDGNERVRIEKRHGALVIDVVSDEETVHVSVPLRVVTSVARRLESARPAG